MVESPAFARYASEFIGTFALVFTIGCNIATEQSTWGGFSIASVLTVMVYALGKSSGAHFNPAVSLALGIAKKIEWKEVALYSATQIFAGIMAGFAYVMMAGLGDNGNFGNHFGLVKELAPTAGHQVHQACFAEFFYTFMLSFVVLNTAASKKHAGKNQFYGLAIGFCIVAGAYGGGSISMGCFNPAVAIGLEVSSVHRGKDGVCMCLLYSLVELVAGAVAAVAFDICRPDESCDGAETQVGSKLVAEFLGTFMLVLTVCLNVLNGSHAAALSVAAALMCMIFALGSVSGAHFNPAVTLAVVCSGRDKCSAKLGCMYAAVQTLAAIVAAFMASMMCDFQAFALVPDNGVWGRIIIAEFVFTFILAFVVLSVATVKEKNVLTEYFGLAIGFCIAAGGYAIGKISSGSMNPALSIGIEAANLINAANHKVSFHHCLVYAAVELAAGVAAAGAFALTQPSEYEDKTQAIQAGGESYGSTV